MNTVRTARELTMTPTAIMRRSLALMAGALVVALGAQAAVPIPGTPVPVTLTVPAVLIVGGLLGPRYGAASLVIYLRMGAAGLPVFAPIGPAGLARLLGPTGGYLLAYPVAAALVGRVVGNGRPLVPLALGMVVGLVVIHVGGVAQLAALGGDVRSALAVGSLPFLLGDVLKLTIAGLVVWRFASKSRALL